MKQIFTSLLLVAGTLPAICQTITWSTPVAVNTGGTYGNLHPKITLNRAGNPLVLWGKTDTRAYCSRWSGTAFSTPIAVGNPGINVFAQSWAGPDIASFGDTVYVVMKRTPETTPLNHMYMCHSYDGGMTFSDTARIDQFDTSLSRFPTVTTTSNGNPLVAFMKFNSAFGDAQYVVSRSTNYGMTISADVLASGMPGDVCDCCPGSIISSGSKAIMLFRNDLSNIRDIWAGVSNDGGMTFPGLMNVDNNNWMIMSCPSSGPDGFVIGDSLYSVFRSSAGGTAKVYLSKGTLSGLTSSTAAIAGSVTGLLSQDYPRIANAGTAAIITWLQNTSSGKSIVYSFTSNISSGFSSGVITVAGATGSGIANADVAMKPGAIHIVWEDDNTGNVMYAKGTYTVPVTSVVSLANKEKIEIYPNPATSEFYVTVQNISNISSCFLTDNVGRNLELQPTIKGDKAIFSLQGIAKGGYYFIMHDNSGKSYYSKLIVE